MAVQGDISTYMKNPGPWLIVGASFCTSFSWTMSSLGVSILSTRAINEELRPMSDFTPLADRMKAEGLPTVVIDTFAHYFEQLAAGETGLIPESEIESVESLPDADDFPAELAEAGKAALSKTVYLKLNGGLGTGMGLAKAKSLLKVKNGQTFLDIIAHQATHAQIPLVLMDSFSTRDDTLEALKGYPELSQGDIPLDFLQHKVPKIAQADLAPAVCEHDHDLEWCPPGHGDLYTAMITSGMLASLLDHGYEYAFVSNSDNLGAVIDTSILGYFAVNKLPFLMEVADRTEADKKGGHLARRPDGQLLLRELAQCPDEDEATFQDVSRHRYFNTNSLWVHLPSLQKVLDEKNGILGLPMLRNGKTVDPRDKASQKVWQIETAMGSAIEIFEGAGAVRVPMSRFAPIKKTSDLLDVRSDNYVLTEDHRIVANPDRKLGRCIIQLDDIYKFVDDLEARFPYGPPSLIGCESLRIEGDVKFGRDVVLEGKVELINHSGGQVLVDVGAVLSGTRTW